MSNGQNQQRMSNGSNANGHSGNGASKNQKRKSNGESSNALADALKAFNINSQVNMDDVSPVRRLTELGDSMREIIDAVENIQKENEKLKARFLEQRAFAFTSWFSEASKGQMTRTFNEWKKILYKKRAVEFCDKAVAEAVEKKHQEWLEKHIEQAKHHEEHVEAVHREHKERHENHLNEVRNAHAVEIENHRHSHALMIERLTNDHNDVITAKDEHYTNLLNEKESQKETERKEKERITALHTRQMNNYEKAERALSVMKQAMDDYKPESGTFEDDDPTPLLPNDSALGYVKNALHEVLYSVDPRYLGRSATPTVREISLMEREAYAAAQQQAAMESQQGDMFDLTQPLSYTPSANGFTLGN